MAPDASGAFKGISVPALPWLKKCKCKVCKCDLAAADQALKDGRTVNLKDVTDG
jgi:hypothetical protein